MCFAFIVGGGGSLLFSPQDMQLLSNSSVGVAQRLQQAGNLFLASSAMFSEIFGSSMCDKDNNICTLLSVQYDAALLEFTLFLCVVVL